MELKIIIKYEVQNVYLFEMNKFYNLNCLNAFKFFLRI